MKKFRIDARMSEDQKKRWWALTPWERFEIGMRAALMPRGNSVSQREEPLIVEDEQPGD